ncbi:AraC family transcriptional regulator [Paenibacillus alkalitolerans]|uniref:AraC family transcriptional regulator n=1 Tax=Paenibacillus alkalitolerans TaxID=2799335 RepID=UPI0018F3ABEB|nr:AraC family transcriptional regulator [Paenibacillus alkalitolerans]
MTTMPNRGSFWKKYIANVKLDCSVAAYTKVPVTWNEDNYVPDFNKLYFILEGEGYVKVGDRTFNPKPGQLYLMPAGITQSYGTIGDNTFGKYWCHFTAEIGQFPLFQIVETPYFVDISDREQLTGAFDRLIYWRRRDEITSVIHINSILLEIIALFIDRSESVKLNTKITGSLDKMNTVLQYIDDHLSDPLSVDTLAQIAHFHPNYFIRVFKETTGFSPIQYVNRLRIEKAKHYLSFTRLNVSAIAETLSMDVSYFSRMFKEYTGFSPTEYRELLP